MVVVRDSARFWPSKSFSGVSKLKFFQVVI
jgi:hypothetical protein